MIVKNTNFCIDFSTDKKPDKKHFPFFKKSATLILHELRFDSAALSVMIVRDKKMAELNQRQMGHRGTTDVLSFSYLEKRGKVRLTQKVLSANPPTFLGEIVICLDEAMRNAKEYQKTFKYECALYLCHGILHCLGYEDKTKEGFLEMQKRQEKLLNKLSLQVGLS